MKLHLFSLLLLSISFSTYSQETTESSNSLENQFDNIYRTSSSYQVYKVISKERFQQLKLNVLDSIKSSKENIITKNNQLLKEKNKIEENKVLLNNTKLALEKVLKSEDSISFLGLQLNKTTYNISLWSIISVLFLALAYFIFKFYRSNILTKEAQSVLIDVEHEFDKHRKKSLEREQKLRRQLQDEINKQRNT
ncbi:MAG: hypothetical protein ABJH82_08695 [Polaribacter sp.]|uniref:hypothetical protein n=1 Tax=Polaribacter sp. TaxID=1920175 RepID=UPI0032674EFE